ncbi:MAG: MerR family DNA-binding transcriptional regulator [Clostridia bacterium]|nr:MerR family DNA-binding transcriptional regulator [Clostridia bacterium]
MYTIGQFSQIGKVSVKTLRYYDSIFLNRRCLRCRYEMD